MNVMFTPKAYQDRAANVDLAGEHHAPAPQKKSSDKISMTLLKVMRYAVVALMFLVPIFFVPRLQATLGFDKALITLGISLLVVVLASLSVLRLKKVSTVLPLPLALFAGLTLSALVSALLSGDVSDGIRGSLFEVQTVGFMAVMLLSMAVPLVLQQSKKMSLTALIAFAAAAGLVILYNLLRLIFGAEFLSFASFGTLTASPIGGFNDLAVFSSVIVVLGLVTILQLPLKKWMQWTVSGFVLVSLMFLMVVNFFSLWLITGFFGLLFLIYLLTKDTLFSNDNGDVEAESNTPPILIFLTLIICVVSALFVIAGDYAGGQISQMTNINYIEVRPSMGATIDMVKAVYQEDAFLGSGPNRFADVWRENKDIAINETAFWNVDFVTGYGLVPTMFVTLGLLGALLLLAFHASYLFLGYKMLLKTSSDDSFWYYVGTASFTATIVLWAIAYLYAPGAAVLIITALFTGLTFVAYQALVPAATKTIPLANSRRQGFFLMAISVIAVVGSVVVLFGVGKQYIAEANFTEIGRTATTIEEYELGVQSSYQLFQDDKFVLAWARAKTSYLLQLLGTPEPTEADQQAFVTTAQQTIQLAQEAIRLDPTRPDGYAILADVYYALAQAGIEGAQDQALAVLQDAKWRDPMDPSYDLFSAYITAQTGDTEGARTNAQQALSLKRNYGEALFLLAQLDIQDGNVEGAIATTQQLVTFEPNNPTRYYQLGILLAANQQFQQAVAAYQQAIRLDTNFANARYMLALTLVELGNIEQALTELRTVQENNQENAELADLIARLEAGEDITSPELGLETPVSETDPNETTEDGVVTSADTDSDLVSPVNTPGASSEAPAEAESNTETTEEPAQ